MYEGIDRKHNEEVAIKIFNREKIFKTTGVEVLKKEIKIHSSLVHPHIIEFYDFCDNQENYYIIMELAQNGNLDSYRKSKGFLEENEAFVYFLQTLLAIEYLHNRNIVHRDIKPENLLFDRDCNIKLCDFGWSDKQNEDFIRQTFCGTLHYMAPEIIRQEQYSYPVDIWSLGVFLYELTHGKTPFEESNRSVLSETQKSPDWKIKFMPDISVGLKDLITNLLKNDPKKRLGIDQIFYHPWVRRKAVKVNANINVLRFQNSKEGTRISQSTIKYNHNKMEDSRTTVGKY